METQAIITPDIFGTQHWVMILRVEAWVTMNNGEIEKDRMRTNYNKRPPKPLKAIEWDKLLMATRLNNGTLIDDHDDWDCLEDLINNDFVKVEVWKNKKLVSLTEKGFNTFIKLRKHRHEGNKLANFKYH